MPPRPVMMRRRMVVKRILNASSSRRSPLSNALLLKVVASPNSTPEIRTRRSWPKVLLLTPDPKLFVKRNAPKRVNSAVELSAYGADRNIPAGDMMCRRAVIKANLFDGKSVKVRLCRARVENRWEM
ncbi:hypothetical protein BGAL_0333g00090 [Botrytis galanthina]|uniref:Uncharacterized protein n=1 Tax=Botrytis galanthina TaxID=278940 RepID=A0A4S8QPT6_9HELO|nr:hypothetical protein BGAL_0333g00090 [Botrytis galanthina]